MDQSELVSIALFLTLSLGRLDTDLLVVLLQRRQVFARLGELALFHTLADIPVHKRALRVHQIELVVNAAEDLSDGGGVADHAARTHDLGQVAAGNHSGRLIVDSTLKAGGAPVNELDGALGLDSCHRCVDILGHHIATVHHAARHVLAVARIALHEHRRRLEDRHCDLSNAELLMVGLLSGDDRRIARQHKVDARVGHQISLALRNTNAQPTAEPQRSRERGDDLRQQAVQVGVGGTLDVEVAAADVIERLVVVHDGDVGMFEQGVHAQDRIVRLHNGRRHLGACPHREADLRLLAVVDREALKHQASQARPRATTDSVIDHEALKARTVIGELPDAIEHQVYDLLADCIVPASEIIRSILLSRDQLLGMKELAICSGTDFVDNSGLEVDHHAAGDVLAGAGLTEEGVEGIVSTTDGLVRWHLSIWLDTVLEAEELPARIADLHAGLTDVDTESLAHSCDTHGLVR